MLYCGLHQKMKGVIRQCIQTLFGEKGNRKVSFRFRIPLQTIQKKFLLQKSGELLSPGIRLGEESKGAKK